MAKRGNQKGKIVYLLRIFWEYTDEEHALSMNQLIEALAAYGVQAERKSIYDDLETLRLLGFAIETRREKTVGYYLAERPFEVAEQKLLVDAIAASRFLSQKKTRQLITKVEKLGSVHQGRLLQRQVFVANRPKTPNEGVYYHVDQIHQAIGLGQQIAFCYEEWTLDYSQPGAVRRRPRHGGKAYRVSPWALGWMEENYYLIAYDGQEDKVKHYRVDKIAGVTLLPDLREGLEAFHGKDPAIYMRQVFGMYGGEECQVRLKIHNRLIGAVIDRFGKQGSISRCDGEHFYLRIQVNISPRFYGWVFGFGEDMEIVSPPWVRANYINQSLAVLARHPIEGDTPD